MKNMCAYSNVQEFCYTTALISYTFAMINLIVFQMLPFPLFINQLTEKLACSRLLPNWVVVNHDSEHI